MALYPNATDDDIVKRESAAADSSIMLSWWTDGQTAKRCNIKAYDAQRELQATPQNDVKLFTGNIIGSHNDKPHKFETPGKA